MRTSLTASIRMETAIVLALAGLLAGCPPGSSGGGTTSGSHSSGADAAVAPADGGASDGGCTPGTLGCACAAGGGCTGALTCVSGQCVEAPPAGIRVSSDEARACELLLREGQATVQGVDLSAGMRGKFVREPPGVAVAFASEADAPIAAGSVRLQVQGDISNLTLRQARCFDRLGRALTDVQVTLE